MQRKIMIALRLGLLMFILFAALSSQPAHSEKFVGETEIININTSHPYKASYAGETIEYFQVSRPNATFILVHFSNFSLNGGDYVEIRDGKNILRHIITNDNPGRTDFWSLAVDGDTVFIRLVAGSTEGQAYGFDIDRYGYGIAAIGIESICGTNDLVDIECLSGTTKYQRAKSVGRMLFYKTDPNPGFYACTGFLVSGENHFLTNEHCVNNQAITDTLQVWFNYQYATCGGGNLASYGTYYGETFLVANHDYDCSLVTLFGDPQATYGHLELEPRAMMLNETVYIPQHPGGDPKKYDDGPVVDTVADGYASNSDFGYQVDTEPGSSGSPVLSVDSHKVVGLHHFSGCDTYGGQNQGVLMEKVYPIIEPFLPSGEGDLLKYVPVTPCRIVDTRDTSEGMIAASMGRNFHVYGDGGTIGAQGGNPSGCPSPLGEPSAVHISVAAVDPTGQGNLKAFPVGAPPNAGLTVNFASIGTPLNNAGTVKTFVGTGPDISLFARYAGAHATVQVLGYYYPNGDLFYTPVTPCRIVDTRDTSGGMIAASTGRNFYVYGDGGTIGAQGGNPSGCPSPLGEPSAVHISVAAVDPTGQGNLKAFPVGAPPNAGLTVNYASIGTNLNNAGTVMTSVGTGPDISLFARYAGADATVQVLGYYYPNGDLLYTPVTPCRIVDTRDTSGGMIAASTGRNFYVYGDGGTIGAQGGNPSGCPSPLGEPSAVHISVAAVDPTGQGNLKAFPVGAPPNAGLTVNYASIGTNLNNAGTVMTSVGTGADISLFARYAGAHATVQVLGYYYPIP